MADIEITRSHALGTEDAKAAVEGVAQDLEKDLGVSYRWEGDTLRFERTGAEGRIDVEPEAVHLAIDVGQMVKWTVGTDHIRNEAERMLDERLSPRNAS